MKIYNLQRWSLLKCGMVLQPGSLPSFSLHNDYYALDCILWIFNKPVWPKWRSDKTHCHQYARYWLTGPEAFQAFSVSVNNEFI